MALSGTRRYRHGFPIVEQRSTDSDGSRDRARKMDVAMHRRFITDRLFDAVRHQLPMRLGRGRLPLRLEVLRFVRPLAAAEANSSRLDIARSVPDRAFGQEPNIMGFCPKRPWRRRAKGNSSPK